MKSFLRNLLLSCLIAPALWLAAQPGTAQAQSIQEIDRIVAVVNDDVIMLSELKRKLRLVLEQLRQSDTRLPPQETITRQVLENLVMERLQLQVAASTGITVDDDSLNRAIAGLAKQNNLSLSDFRAVLERDDYDFNRFREDIRNEMIIGRLRQRQIVNQINVTPQEIDNFLANQATRSGDDSEYHLGHILIAVPDAASPEAIQQAEQKARDTLESLKEGADFRQTAVSVSSGQQALEGGDLGWRKMGEVPILFSDTVAGMAPGELAGPIRSPSGFHIIKLIERRGGERHVITQTHARHILIKTSEVVSQDDARVRLEQLRERIQGGADFSDLARSNSDDLGSATNGGDLGWVKPGDLVPEFEQVMGELRPGQVSRPFRTRFGWHIVQALDRRQQDDTLEYQRSRAAEAIRKRKAEEETETWLRRMRDEAYVELRLDE
jgi:peptidyl-prolyl cis-trans isomerase SurA